jgi:hypothetical protein
MTPMMKKPAIPEATETPMTAPELRLLPWPGSLDASLEVALGDEPVVVAVGLSISVLGCSILSGLDAWLCDVVSDVDVLAVSVDNGRVVVGVSVVSGSVAMTVVGPAVDVGLAGDVIVATIVGWVRGNAPGTLSHIL